MTFVKNTLTGFVYDFEKNTNAEKALFRVMPLDSTEKLYFDTKDQYFEWRKNNKLSLEDDVYSIPGLSYDETK